MTSTEITKEDFYRARGETYDQSNDDEAWVRYQNAARWMVLGDSVSVREIGCKFAVFRDLLSRENVRGDYAAVDIDLATLQRIPGYDPAQFICHNVNRSIPFPDESADYVLALEVMEHLENPTHFLREVKRILRPGGRLVLSVPNPYCWMEWLANVRREPDVEGHVASFTGQNLDALLRFVGLRLVDRCGTFTRVPFSRRITGRYRLVRTDSLLLTRSLMFLIERVAGEVGP